MDEYTDMFFKSAPGVYLKQIPKRIVVEGTGFKINYSNGVNLECEMILYIRTVL